MPVHDGCNLVEEVAVALTQERFVFHDLFFCHVRTFL
jgi:hypothetical protein